MLIAKSVIRKQQNLSLGSRAAPAVAAAAATPAPAAQIHPAPDQEVLVATSLQLNSSL